MSSKVTKSVKAAVKSAVKSAVKPATNAGTRKPPAPVNVSPQLAQLINATTITRPQALKSLWAYIKEKNTPKNDAGRYICQGPLKDVIGKEQFSPPDVMRAISKHLTKIETPK